MTLRLYNTLTRTKEDFAPLNPKNIRMYVCGPTVYDFAHIGNARPAIVFDVLFRFLRHLYKKRGAKVTYVRNITDVDDKINERAVRENISIRALTEKTARVYNKDIKALGCLRPSVTPRATEHIKQMVAMIERLIALEYAYHVDGHVLFYVAAKADYGKLSRRSENEINAGARVEIAPYKRGVTDFVLWKPSDNESPGWDSPWGRGRPGWHIECSAMAGEYLGETFDIHGGGLDLMFPHHENEIAQSEGAHCGKPLAKTWMHNGFLQVEGEKMSKSLGNFLTINGLLEEYPGAALRFAMLQTHYRQPINWTKQKVEDSWSELRDWAGIVYNTKAEHDMNMRFVRKIPPKPHYTVIKALEDDLNTPEAVAALRALFKQRSDEDSFSALIETCEFLGIFDRKTIGAYFRGVSGTNLGYETTFRVHADVQLMKVAVINHNGRAVAKLKRKLAGEGVDVALTRTGDIDLRPLGNDATQSIDIQQLIDLRNLARKNRDFKESDRIRDQLLDQGIELKDDADGLTSWAFKK